MIANHLILTVAFALQTPPPSLPPALPAASYVLGSRTPRARWTPEDDKSARQKRRGKGATDFYWTGEAFVL